MWADQAFDRFLEMLAPDSKILDVGSGQGEHARFMEQAGHDVERCDLAHGCDFMQDFFSDQYYDAIWASHVLEHFEDVSLSLRRIHNYLRWGGLLAVTVPPMKSEIVGGHLSLWNAGLLLYRLVLAGFDCSAARVGTYGYNCSVIVREKNISPFPKLTMDHGDIGRLSAYFPPGINGDGFNGDIKSINW